MTTKAETNEYLRLIRQGREDYGFFKTRALDMDPAHYWHKMKEVDDSVRDNERTAVGAGHGVSKTYGAARTALTFLYCHYPSTVITTAPSEEQVKTLWREIRNAHTYSKIPLGGKLTTMMLDMQPSTGMRWFALNILSGGRSLFYESGSDPETSMSG